PSERNFYLTFGAAPRFVGKAFLNLTENERQEAYNLRPGFDPSAWTVDQTCRILLMLNLPHHDPGTFVDTLKKLFETAEMDELVALYASLPLLPYPQKHLARASEGIRTNIAKVFDAVALQNPYPKEYFEEGAWNQMVLKAIFMDRPIYKIQGLSERANPKLTQMLSDFAHERWAAGRTTSPELWRPVGAQVNINIMEDLKKLFQDPDVMQRQAAALVCHQTELAEAKELLKEHADLQNEIATSGLTWDNLAIRYWRTKSD
ncbi:MAG: EboA domain-containing protein, partial [Cyclobacteriaceae bacterium]